MTWQFMDKLFDTAPQDYQGFVYEIHDTKNNRYYIGKKNFWRIEKLKPLKGKTNRRHRRKESDWHSYYGSNLELQKQVQLLGESYFKRKILILCANKNQMSYFEMKKQFEYDVLLDNRYYNSYIGGRITARGLKNV